MPTITRANAAAFQRPLSRPTPLLPVTAMKTYAVARPISWRIFASCEQIGCCHYLEGWRTIVPTGSDLAETVRASGRRYIIEDGGAGLTVYRFPPGQRCFRAPPPAVVGRPITEVLPKLDQPQPADRWHKRVIDREPLVGVYPGDWRGRVGPIRMLRVDQWIDDFATHQDRLATKLGR